VSATDGSFAVFFLQSVASLSAAKNFWELLAVSSPRLHRCS